MKKMELKNEIKKTLPFFTGTEEWTKHSPLLPLIYTDGVCYLAETAQCYWLIDIVASLYAHPYKIIEKNEFISITLKTDLEKCSAVFTADDGNNTVLYTQIIPYTDFPLEEIKMFLTDNVLLLPSEN